MPAIKLYDYQRAYLQDQARFKLAMFARQTGKTFTTTLEIVDSIYQAIAEQRRETWVILSRGERQAREAFREGVLRHAKAYQLAAADIQPIESEFAAGKDRYLQLEWHAPGGSRVIALPANPDTARGYSANVFLDEFAIHQDSREIWGALFPLISAGYKLRVTSTPKGKANKFYELWENGGNVWSRHRCDIHQAVAQGLPRNVAELRQGLNDEELWSQEFELQFVDESTSWLPWDLINGCEHVLAGKPDLYTGNDCVVGVDIGRRKDLFVIQVLERMGDVYWQREEIVLRAATFAEQDAALDRVFRAYKVAACFMDQTGLGEKPVEDAQRRHGPAVTGVVFGVGTKARMAKAAKRAFEDRKVRIGTGDQALREDLHKIKKDVRGETVLFTADRDADGHADRAWALFLALDAASGPVQTYAFTPLASRGQPAPDDDDDTARDAGRGMLA